MPTDTKRERQRRYYVEMLRRYNETPPLDAQGNVVYPAFVDELPDRPLPPPARPLAGEGLRPPPSIGVQQTRREEAQERLRQPPPGPTPTPRRMAPPEVMAQRTQEAERAARELGPPPAGAFGPTPRQRPVPSYGGLFGPSSPVARGAAGFGVGMAKKLAPVITSFYGANTPEGRAALIRRLPGIEDRPGEIGEAVGGFAGSLVTGGERPQVPRSELGTAMEAVEMMPAVGAAIGTTKLIDPARRAVVGRVAPKLAPVISKVATGTGAAAHWMREVGRQGLAAVWRGVGPKPLARLVKGEQPSMATHPVVDKIVKVIKAAKRMHEDVEPAVEAERQRRVAMGVAAYTKAMAAGKGEKVANRLALQATGGKTVPRPDSFEAPVWKMTEDEENTLYRLVGAEADGKFKDRFWDKTRAISALEDILGTRATPSTKVAPNVSATARFTELGRPGYVPQRADLDLLEQVFGTDFSKAVWGKRPDIERALEFGGAVANVPRTIMTAYDLSAPLRQGIVLATGHPVRFSKAFGRMIQAALSEDKAQALIAARMKNPNYKVAQSSNLYLAPLGRMGGRGLGEGLTSREEAFLSPLARILPGVRMSERSYVTFLNELRFGVWDDVYRGWKKSDAGFFDRMFKLSPFDEKSAAGRQALAGLSRFINRATGRGGLTPSLGIPGKKGVRKWDLEGLGVPLSAIFFSPRLLISRFLLPVSLLEGSGRARLLIAKDLISFVSTGVSVLSLLKLSGAADVGVDPRNSDFGKIKVGTQRIDFWGGYNPIARLVAQLITNERQGLASKRLVGIDRKSTIWRFIRSKLSPAAGLVTDLGSGETFLNEEMQFSPTAGPGRPWEESQIFQRLAPLFVQDLVDAIREEGLDGTKMAAPGFFGAGVQAFRTVDDMSLKEDGIPFADNEPHRQRELSMLFKAEQGRSPSGEYEAWEKEKAELQTAYRTLVKTYKDNPNKSAAGRILRQQYKLLKAEHRGVGSGLFFEREDYPPPDVTQADPQKRALAEYHQKLLEIAPERGDPFETDEWVEWQKEKDRTWPKSVRDYVARNTKMDYIPPELLSLLPVGTTIPHVLSVKARYEYRQQRDRERQARLAEQIREGAR